MAEEQKNSGAITIVKIVSLILFSAMAAVLLLNPWHIDRQISVVLAVVSVLIALIFFIWLIWRGSIDVITLAVTILALIAPLIVEWVIVPMYPSKGPLGSPKKCFELGHDMGKLVVYQQWYGSHGGKAPTYGNTELSSVAQGTIEKLDAISLDQKIQEPIRTAIKRSLDSWGKGKGEHEGAVRLAARSCANIILKNHGKNNQSAFRLGYNLAILSGLFVKASAQPWEKVGPEIRHGIKRIIELSTALGIGEEEMMEIDLMVSQQDNAFSKSQVKDIGDILRSYAERCSNGL